MHTLIIDNYDSFTYNLFQFIGELKGNPVIYKNDELNISTISKLNPSHIIISPGPGTVLHPKDFGNCENIILNFMDKKPILGVCLGHQGIVKALGGNIETSPQIMHGKQSLIQHDGSILFKNVPTPFQAMRYHSLCANIETLPSDLKITAQSLNDKTIMAVMHSKYPLFGIQFHPESFLTDSGQQILSNFLSV